MFEQVTLGLAYRNVWLVKADGIITRLKCFVDFTGQPVTPSLTLRSQSAANANTYTHSGTS